jgi:Ca2+-binding RTX toxin-like protein
VADAGEPPVAGRGEAHPVDGLGAAAGDRGWIGDDRLVGDGGNDRMLGQGGNDTFVFRPGFGRDAIVDFTAGAGTPDVIEFSTSVFANFAAVQAGSQQVGANTVIRVDADNFIVLEQVQRANLDASDFMFV